MKKEVLLNIDQNYIKRYKNLGEEFIGKKIVMYDDRYNHIEKHRNEFISVESYNVTINSLEDIIKNPEFIAIDSKNNSLEFIKKITENVLVAVRVSNSKELKIKTLYPINDKKKNRLKNRIG